MNGYGTAQRVLVTGSRDWKDEEELCLAIAEATGLSDSAVIVHGGARGADAMAGALAKNIDDFTEEVHLADWKTHGKAAGFIRNKEMVDAGADVCLAFILNESRGATMCADLAEKAGIPVIRYEVND